MKVESRKRVFWFYLILAIIFLFFYLLILESRPNNPNYNYSEALIRKLMNSPRLLKVTYLFLFIVSSTSFIGFIISSIIKDAGYRKSFTITFLSSTIIALLLFIYFAILK